MKYLDVLVHRLAARGSLDERLDCFARIAEIARLYRAVIMKAVIMKDDAEGCFELASQPVRAQILNSIKAKK